MAALLDGQKPGSAIILMAKSPVMPAYALSILHTRTSGHQDDGATQATAIR